jgi:monomeric sarcosine oxidase
MLNAASPKPSCVVVGAGVFGVWTAHRLLLDGHKVVLLDQYGPANNRASSGGETRIIRCSYGPDEIYSRMAKRSLELWAAFFAKAGRPLLQRVGVLWMAQPDDKYVQQSRETLKKCGVPFQDLSAEALRRRYPQIRTGSNTIAIFEPDSGALMARQSVHAVLNAFLDAGGVYSQAAVRTPRGHGTLSAIQTIDGEQLKSDIFVFACGAWLPKVFPELLGRRIFPTRQDVLFFGIPGGDNRFSPPAMPVWIDFSDNRGMYGFPDLDARGFKLAFDLHGPEIDPDTANRIVLSDKIAEARTYLSDRFPALANAPILETRVCQYENTANGDFLIDRHPEFENVWLVGGGSGHGFKHGPAVGEYVAARVNGASSPPLEPRFLLANKSTQQQRSVF